MREGEDEQEEVDSLVFDEDEDECGTSMPVKLPVGG